MLKQINFSQLILRGLFLLCINESVQAQSTWGHQKKNKSLVEKGSENKHLLEAALYSGLIYRCQKNEKLFECSKGASVLVGKLDISIFKSKPVVFTQKLQKIFLSKKTYLILKSIQEFLDADNREKSIEEYVMPHFAHINEFYEFMGVVFQDTSSNLESSVNENRTAQFLLASEIGNEEVVKRLVSEYLQVLEQLDQLEKEGRFHHLFPQEVDGFFSDYQYFRIYHFYVVRHLRDLLLKSDIEFRLSGYLSFLFNYIYEVISIDGSIRYTYIDPEHIESNAKKLDIAAAYFAVSSCIEIANQPKEEAMFLFTQFLNSLEVDTGDGIELVYFNI